MTAEPRAVWDADDERRATRARRSAKWKAVAEMPATAPEYNALLDDEDAEDETLIRQAIARVDGEAPAELTSQRLADVAPSRVTWLWPGRIPLGKITILDGDPGLGKSTILLDIAARGSVASSTPTGEPLPLFSTIIVTTEDDASDTIRPRFDLAGGDPSRIHVVTDLTLPNDAERLERLIIAKHALFVYLDPVVESLGDDVRTASDHAIRRALRPVVGIAQRLGTAIVGIRHLNKQGGLAAIYRGGGTIGFAGLARSVLAVARNPEDPEQFVLASVKINVARRPPSLAYQLVAAGPYEPARVEWLGESDHDAESLIGSNVDPERSKKDAMAHTMRELVDANGGQMLARDMYAALEAEGFNLNSENMKTRARRAAKLDMQPPAGIGGGWTVKAR